MTGGRRRRILVAGVGNVLRGDDGFGPAVIGALEADGALPDGVRLVEVGIGGIGLVHELMDGYDALVIVDAVHRDDPPGSLYVLEPELPETVSHDELAADLHEVVPIRVLVLARSLGILPPVVRIVGCQPEEVNEFSLDLTATVQRAVAGAVETVRSLVEVLRAEDAGRYGP